MNADTGKIARLRAASTLNPHPENVCDERFLKDGFFDPNDLLQVRYEMVRLVNVKNSTLVQAAQRFGVSKPTCYRVCRAFREGGLQALIPAPRGPQAPYKITVEILEFADRYRSTYGYASAYHLVPVIEQEFGVRLHPRGLEKALKRQQKKTLRDNC